MCMDGYKSNLSQCSLSKIKSIKKRRHVEGAGDRFYQPRCDDVFIWTPWELLLAAQGNETPKGWEAVWSSSTGPHADSRCLFQEGSEAGFSEKRERLWNSRQQVSWETNNSTDRISASHSFESTFGEAGGPSWWPTVTSLADGAGRSGLGMAQGLGTRMRPTNVGTLNYRCCSDPVAFVRSQTRRLENLAIGCWVVLRSIHVGPDIPEFFSVVALAWLV